MLFLTELAWQQIQKSTQFFPLELVQLFCLLRQKLAVANKEDCVDIAVSSCIFLRFICPAILSPSLFGLMKGKNFDSTIKIYCIKKKIKNDNKIEKIFLRLSTKKL